MSEQNEHQKELRKEVGVSEGGSTIYEYDEQEEIGWRPPEAYGTYMEDIEGHFENLFPGRESFVFHEIVSDLVHLDVHILKPTEDNNFYVMYTTGMSDKPMNLPESLQDDAHKHLERAELFMLLPPTWNPGEAGTLSNDIPYEEYWPIQMIKYLARFPHEYNTWFAWGHTIPNGAAYEPIIDGSDMGGFVLLELDENFSPAKAADGTPIHLYMVMPAYKEEIEYKLKHGMGALDDLYTENDLPLVMDMHRKNVCENLS